MATSVSLLQKLPNELFNTNPLNVEVFLAVASHEVFRQQVKEIIWDDATFRPVPTQGSYDYYTTEFGYTSDEDDINNNCMTYQPKGKISGWFVQHCKSEIFSAESRLTEKGQDNEQQRRIDNLMPSREALSHYNRLVQQQDNVIKSGADETAFRYVLQESRFPHLEKVTVTPATHGFLFFPLYETPMIRAFPYGFVYPIQRGWTCAGHIDDDMPQPAEPWEDEEEKRKWRGFRIVSRHLADPKLPHNISQLSFDNHKLATGINHFVFDQPNEEYDNLCRTLERPGLKSFTLSLLMGYLSADCDAEEWNFFKKGRLRSLIAGAHALEEITLQSDYPVDMTCWEGPEFDSISLFDIFPVEQWSTGSLKHFGLSGIQVVQDDLISLLGKLPPTLVSIELSFLSIIEGTGHYAGILADIRDKLGWRHRPIDRRIRVRVLVRLDQTQPGRYTCLDKEVNDYLYGNGHPPFGVNEYGGGYAEVEFGNGMQYDEFDPDFARPYGRNR